MSATAGHSESQEALYVSKRGRPAGVLLDADRHAELIKRLEFLAVRERCGPSSLSQFHQRPLKKSRRRLSG
jgi:hypothetical protein